VIRRFVSFPSSDPTQIVFEGNATYSTWRPSGRNDGKRWALSPSALSGVVRGTGWPPDAATLNSPPVMPPRTITPSRFHVPPLTLVGVSQTVWTGPPETSTVL